MPLLFQDATKKFYLVNPSNYYGLLMVHIKIIAWCQPNLLKGSSLTSELDWLRNDLSQWLPSIDEAKSISYKPI